MLSPQQSHYYRHHKTLEEYLVRNLGQMKVNGQWVNCVIYQAMSPPQQIFVRPVAEFCERFRYSRQGRIRRGGSRTEIDHPFIEWCLDMAKCEYDVDLARQLGLQSAQISKMRHGVLELPSANFILGLHELTGIPIKTIKATIRACYSLSVTDERLVELPFKGTTKARNLLQVSGYKEKVYHVAD